MLDKIVYKFFAGLDILCVKIDSVFYAGYEKIRSFFKLETRSRDRCKWNSRIRY